MTNRRWAALAIVLWRREKHAARRAARIRLIHRARTFESPETKAQRIALANLRRVDWSSTDFS